MSTNKKQPEPAVALTEARERVPARKRMTSLMAMTARLADDERGSTAMLFGLMVIPCIMLLGMAVDFGRVITVRGQMQGVLDAAALAGGRAAQTATANYESAAQAAATKYWDTVTIPHVVEKSALPTVASNASKTEFQWTATAWVATPFMSIAGIRPPGDATPAQSGAPSGCQVSWFQCMKVTATSQSILQSGGSNNDKNIETSLMLDVTGSMSGTKITDLKAAAKDLIDIVVWSNQTTVTSKVALAPFADGINVGPTMAAAARGTVTAGTNPILNNPGVGYQNFWFTQNGGGGTRTYALSANCVSERTGVEAYTDAAPSVAKVGRAYLETNGSCSLVNTSDSEVNLVTPLSSDKTMLKQRIDKLTLAGSTAGQLGTAWAWYLLSPNWKALFPTTAEPRSYTDSQVKKIAVLMTDGDYNTQFWNGTKDKYAYDARSNGTAQNGDSEDQARSLCSAMKTKGIEVYTVGFQVSTAAKAFLTACATDNSHYYDATSGDALKMAFRDIALKISSLRLSK